MKKSGALTGLQRVREMFWMMVIPFVAPEQIEEEFKKILQLIIDVYEDFNLTDYRFRLSYRDPEDKHKYFDNDEMGKMLNACWKQPLMIWVLSTMKLKGSSLLRTKIGYPSENSSWKRRNPFNDPIGLLLPERFDLQITLEQRGEEHRPVMIHRGVISTMERFTAILIENYKGVFPTGLRHTK